jgi:hypothetical protein
VFQKPQIFCQPVGFSHEHSTLVYIGLIATYQGRGEHLQVFSKNSSTTEQLNWDADLELLLITSRVGTLELRSSCRGEGWGNLVYTVLFTTVGSMLSNFGLGV